MKMNRTLKVAAAVALAASLNCAVGRAQAPRDPKIIGTYIGVVMPHLFPLGGGLNFDVYGGLYTFYLDYNAFGFHEGRSGSTGGVLFAEGKKLVLTGEFTVDPFVAASSRVLNMFLRADIQRIGELVVGLPLNDSATWTLNDEVPYGTFEAIYFRNNEVCYQNPAAEVNLIFDNAFLPGGPFFAAVEAARVSTSRISGLKAKVKVRR